MFFEKTTISKNYRVEVLQTKDNEVAYSYEVNGNEEKTITPCAGRFFFKKYFIEIKFSHQKT
ncbi:MAG: hypothetical protein V3U92_17530 [Cellulophaga sp.]